MSDIRIQGILGSGRLMQSLVDPDGLTRSALPVRHSFYRMQSGLDLWSLVLRFGTGYSLDVRGTCDTSGKLSVTEVKLVSFQNVSTLSTVVSDSLMMSLGNLEKLPLNLRSVLSPARAGNPPVLSDKVFCRSLMSLVLDAAVSGLPSAERQAVDVSRFTVMTLDYEGGAECSGLRAFVCCPIPDGDIRYSFRIDHIGLGDFHLMLHKNLGMGRSVNCECFFTEQERRLPSFKLAYDLSKDLVAFQPARETVPETRLDALKELDKKLPVIKKKKRV